MIISCDEAVARLRALPGLSCCARPLFVLPLLRTGCLSAVLSVEGADAGWEGEFGAAFHALEPRCGVRDETSLGAGVQEVLRRIGASGEDGAWRGRELALLPYTAMKPEWRTALDALGARLVEPAPGPGLPVLGDKRVQRAWLRSVGAVTPPDAVVPALDHRELRRRFGDRYVVQTPLGSSGRGTHLVTDEAGLRPVRRAGAGPWLVSGYVEGAAVNLHVLVSADSTVRLLRPSVQLTRIEGVGAAFGTYSGCDFAAPALLPPLAMARAGAAARRIGEALAALGYRGLFGADFVLDGERPLLLELNCRMQGSTWLLGELELAEHALPSALRHVLEVYGHVTGGEPRTDPAGAVQLVVRHTGGPARVAAAPGAGLHRLKDGRLRYCGAGFGLLECGPDDCVLLQLPSPGTVLHPGVPLARIVARHALTTADGTVLTASGRQLVDALRSGFTLEPVEAPRASAAPC
ncbi:ATP-grasp domain-containing protein [Streptomyces sp. CBMA156]|uniref:ATP-grasp domain-containing protein n=1 Tax=Streptomyces sp. CBMA156 TaxID=1930280 RepID=UPI00166214B6|nr:ATP-grasp domain-containing protein [Streptomyces sp. CBMA156]